MHLTTCMYRNMDEHRHAQMHTIIQREQLLKRMLGTECGRERGEKAKRKFYPKKYRKQKKPLRTTGKALRIMTILENADGLLSYPTLPWNCLSFWAWEGTKETR